MSWVHENKISNTLSAKLLDVQKFVSGGDSDCLQGMQNAVTVYRKKKSHIATLGLGFDGSRTSPDIVFPIVPITSHNPKLDAQTLPSPDYSEKYIDDKYRAIGSKFKWPLRGVP
jgi:hypothetical protein